MKYEEVILAYLKTLPVVRELPTEALRSYIRHGQIQKHRKRSWITRRQELTDLYFILEGTAVRCRESSFRVVELSEMLDGGMHFGDYFFAGSPQSIRAINDCVVLRLNKRNIDMLLEDYRTGVLKQRLAIVNYLDNLKLLHGLNPSNRFAMAAEVQIIQTEKGQLVIHEGEQAENMYSILEGVFDVEKGGKIIAELSQKDSFGEMGIFLQKPRMASVRCKARGTLIRIPRKVLNSIRKKNFHTDFEIEHMTSSRLAEKPMG